MISRLPSPSSGGTYRRDDMTESMKCTPSPPGRQSSSERGLIVSGIDPGRSVAELEQQPRSDPLNAQLQRLTRVTIVAVTYDVGARLVDGKDKLLYPVVTATATAQRIANLFSYGLERLRIGSATPIQERVAIPGNGFREIPTVAAWCRR